MGQEFLAKVCMKLTCSQAALSAALSTVNRAVSPNNTLPVLNNILLRAEGKRLYLSATNLEIAIKASVEARVENEGVITVPAKVITSYVSLLKDEVIELKVVDGGTLEIRSTGSDTKMKGISGEEFPLLPKLESAQRFSLPSEPLREAIEQVAFAASTNISRPVLTGIFWRLEGRKLRLAATDSYRLAEKTLNLEEDSNLDVNFIVPSKTAQELGRILSGGAESFTVEVAKGQIRFEVGGVELISRLIEGNFPDYEKILPKECKTTAELPTSDFILGLKQIALLVKENNNNVKLKLEKGNLSIFSDETQVGEGVVELPVNADGEELGAALNAQYLLEVLSHLKDDRVHFGLNDGLSPVKLVPVRSSGYLHIIMPLKV